MAVTALGPQFHLPSMVPHSQALGILATAATAASPSSPTQHPRNKGQQTPPGCSDSCPSPEAGPSGATASAAQQPAPVDGGQSQSNSRSSESYAPARDGGSPQEDSGSSSSKGKRDASGSTKGGAGISQEELGRLDPKRAKRIMANRLSAARSKERKLRYIAELQEKVANLQNEANSMTHQLRGLCDDTATLGKANEQLLGQVVFFQEQIRGQDQEIEALIRQMDRLKGLREPASPAAAIWDSVPSSRPGNAAAFSLSPFAGGSARWEQPGFSSQGLGRGLQHEAAAMAPRRSLGARHSSLERRHQAPGQEPIGPRPAFPGGRSLSLGAGSLADSVRRSPQQRGLLGDGPRASFPGAHRAMLSQGPRRSYDPPPQQGFVSEGPWGGYEVPSLRRQSHVDVYPELSATGSGLSSTTQLSRYDSTVDPGLLEMLRLEDMYTASEESPAPPPFPPAISQQAPLRLPTPPQGQCFARPHGYQQAQALQELLGPADSFGQTLHSQRQLPQVPVLPEPQPFPHSLHAQDPAQLPMANPAWGLESTASVSSLGNAGSLGKMGSKGNTSGLGPSLANRFLPPTLPVRGSLGSDNDGIPREGQLAHSSSFVASDGWQLFPPNNTGPR